MEDMVGRHRIYINYSYFTGWFNIYVTTNRYKSFIFLKIQYLPYELIKTDEINLLKEKEIIFKFKIGRFYYSLIKG